MTINPKVLDELLANYKKPEDMVGENGLLKQLTKALLERSMQAELNGAPFRRTQLPVSPHLSKQLPKPSFGEAYET